MITRTKSGTIYKESAWASCPAWLTEVQDTPGRITYSGGECQLYTTSGEQYAFLVTTDALDKTSEWVVRAKVKTGNSGPADAVIFTALFDKSSRPTGGFRWADRTIFSAIVANPNAEDNSWGMGYNGPAYEGTMWITGKKKTSTYYVWELRHTSSKDYLSYRNPTDFGTIIRSDNWSWDYDNNPFWFTGDARNDAAYDRLTIDYIHIFASHKITVVGLQAGNAVRLHDVSDNSVLAEAEESEGVAELDCSDVEWVGLSCYLAVYEDDGYTTVIDISDELTDASGGDEYGYEGGPQPPRVDSIDPETSDNNSVVDATLTGKRFAENMVISLTLDDAEIPASTVRVVSAEEAICTFDLRGVATGAWDVVATNEDGLSGALVEGFTVTEYVEPVVLSITSVDPVWAYQNRYVLMTIVGTDFKAGDQVALVNGADAISVVEQTVVSDTQIECSFNVGLAAVGLWDVVLIRSDPAGRVSLIHGFEVRPDPRTGTYLNDLSINDGERYALMYEGWSPGVANLRMAMRDSQLADGQEYLPALSKSDNLELPLRIKVMGETKADLNRNVGLLLQELRKPSILVGFYPVDTSLDPFFYDAYPAAQIAGDEYWSVDYQRRNLAVVTATLSSKPGPRLDWYNRGRGLELAPVTGVNDSFERGLEGWVVAGTGEVTVTSEVYAPDGGGFAALMTNDSGQICALTDAVPRPINPNHHYNLQVGVKQTAGGILLSVDIEFFDEAGESLGTLPLLLPWNPAGDSSWLDAMLVPFNFGGEDRYGKAVIPPSDIPDDAVSAKLTITNDTDGGAANACCIDAIWFGDTEYVVGHQYSGLNAYNIPPGVVPGDCAVPADIYFTDNQQPKPWARYDAGPHHWRSICGTDANWMLCAGLGGKIIFGNGTTWVPMASGTAQDIYSVTATDHNHAWASGRGILLYYNGTKWVTHEFPLLPTLVVDGLFSEWSGAHSLVHWGFTGSSGASLVKGDAMGAGKSAKVQFPAAWQPTVQNPSFELIADNWFKYWYRSVTVNCDIKPATDHKHTGTRSARFKFFANTSGGGRLGSYELGIKPLGTYKLRAWTLFTTWTPGGPAEFTYFVGKKWFEVSCYNAAGAHLATRVSPLLTNMNPWGWVPHDYTFTVPANTAKIAITLCASSPADYIHDSYLWWDDVSLSYVPAPESSTIKTKPDDLVAIYPGQNYTASVAVRGSGGAYRARAVFYNAAKAQVGTKDIRALATPPSTYTVYSKLIGPADYPVSTRYMGIEIYCEDAEQAWASRSIETSNVTLRLTAPAMRGIHAISATNVFAVGDVGTILNSTVIGSWTPMTSPVTANLNAVHAYDDHNVIAVGDNGTIVTNDGVLDWFERTSGVSSRLNAVLVLDGCAYAVGDNGVVLYSEWGEFDPCGVTWTRLPKLDGDLCGICAAESVSPAKTIVFIVGSDGSIWSNESGSFVNLGKAGPTALRSIYMSAPDAGWVAGDNGSLYVGINDTSYLTLTNIIVGQAWAYDSEYSPIAEAVPTATNFTRRLGYYESVSSAAALEFAFRARAHKGKHLPTLSTLLTGDGETAFLLQCQLETVRGDTLTPLNAGQSAKLGITGNGKFREIALATGTRTRWNEIDIPSHWTSPSADLAHINQIVKVSVPTLEGGGVCGVDCLALVPCDRGYCEVWDILTTPAVILDSHGHNVLYSADGTIEAAAILPSSQTHQAPHFMADPQGMNLVIGCWNIADGDERLTPRPRIKLMFRPQFLVAPHD